MNDITAQVLLDQGAKRRHEIDLLRREVACLRAYVIAGEHRPLMMQLWRVFGVKRAH